MRDTAKKAKQKREEREWVESFLQSAQQDEWFGRIIVEFKRGQIDILRHEETFKPPKKKEE